MAGRSKSGGGMPSQRQLRVGELVRHALAEALARGHIQDPALAGHIITVPEVRMTPDLKLATCFVMPLGGREVDAVVAALNRNAKFLRGEIGRQVELKYTPEVRFRADTSFEEGAKIDAILRSDAVQRDLGEDDE
ncbi:ribosome-binding factor A [Agaricicola taiwanensis]|uniref:Ribosome-binding factor A n=1 Tax=Agaricicola taiwanensis TaxID=591372 RepID=A0A8J2VJR6_9RHOB|nr:30S ribosome-binding factor RbfA [Agaricicola taiwanensis]GGE29305.1 ribosome-binding factor A [Agaricicola taiwanensis]